jgi:hypothetical protein
MPIYKSLIFLILLFSFQFLNFSFQICLFLFLKCLLESHLTLFRLSTLLWNSVVKWPHLQCFNIFPHHFLMYHWTLYYLPHIVRVCGIFDLYVPNLLQLILSCSYLSCSCIATFLFAEHFDLRSSKIRET